MTYNYAITWQPFGYANCPTFTYTEDYSASSIRQALEQFGDDFRTDTLNIIRITRTPKTED